MSVPWVRIPPPPNLKATLKGGFSSGFCAYKHFRKYTYHIPLGDYVGTENFSNNLSVNWLAVLENMSDEMRKFFVCFACSCNDFNLVINNNVNKYLQIVL